MTEPLPAPAPDEEPAATSVEVNAPGSQVEVESGSPHQEAVVPASRFNGLMSSFNKLKKDQEDLLNELANLRSQARETPPVSDELQAEVQALRAELRQERLTNAKAKILEEFPEAREFADLFVSDSPDAMRDLAKDISERVKRIVPQTTPAATTETTEQVETQEQPAPTIQQEAPVTPGGSVIPDGAPTEERIQQAIQKRSWTDYLTAKWDRLGESGGLENVEIAS